MSKNNWPWSHDSQEKIQEHADRYLKILMENDKLPHEYNSDVGIAVTRYCGGTVTSEYNLRAVEEKWAS